jgi:hypothetical protein
LSSGTPGEQRSFLDRLYAWINRGMDRVSKPGPCVVAPAPPVRKPRKKWSFEIDGVPHALEIKDRQWRWQPGPRVFLDRRMIGYVRETGWPFGRTEAPFEIDGSQIIVALEWRRDWDETHVVDVFLDGESLLDGRSLDESRASAPAAPDHYETWTYRFRWRLRQADEMSEGSLDSTLWLAYVFLGFVVGLWFGGLPLMVVFTVASFAWSTLWLSWTLAMDLDNLARPELGRARWYRLFGFFLGFPILGALIMLAVGTAFRSILGT